MEECDSDDLLTVLDDIPMAEDFNIDDLLKMGWYYRLAVLRYEVD